MLRATKSEDIAVLLPVHKRAFAGTVGASIGNCYLHDFLTWFATHPSAISRVFEQDNRLLGYVFGAPAGYGNELNPAILHSIIWGITTHPWVLLRWQLLRQVPSRVQSILKRSAPPPAQNKLSASSQHVYRLVGIGVDPNNRGKGIGQQLMTGYEEAVWQQGGDEIQLSVYADNTAARRLYENCGWQRLQTQGEVIIYAKSCNRANHT